MLNNAKFFTSPATPEVTLTVVLHVGQSMVLPWSSLSKQLEQKVSTTQHSRTSVTFIELFTTNRTLQKFYGSHYLKETINN